MNQGAQRLVLLTSVAIAVLIVVVVAVVVGVTGEWSTEAAISIASASLGAVAALTVLIRDANEAKVRGDLYVHKQRLEFELVSRGQDLLTLLAHEVGAAKESAEQPSELAKRYIKMILDSREMLLKTGHVEEAEHLDARLREVLGKQPGWLRWKTVVSQHDYAENGQ